MFVPMLFFRQVVALLMLSFFNPPPGLGFEAAVASEQ